MKSLTVIFKPEIRKEAGIEKDKEKAIKRSVIYREGCERDL